MSGDHERLCSGLEALTVYTSGDPELVNQYFADRRRDGSYGELADGALSFGAVLLKELSVLTGKAEAEVLQDFARAINRHELGSGEEEPS
ncbi:hypothetical protein [Streptomyces sp. NPDC002564]|uniref:hypothetical protein n=1 Tax=Streptomyces sp. NPDC002564 TaxID=3364649 RepID=UPI003692BA3C